jgi:streptogramin lyase
MIMKKASKGVSILLLLVLMVIPFSAAFAAGPAGVTTTYLLPGSPLHVAIEGAGRVWVTLPAQNAIGRLEVTSPGMFNVQTYQLPTLASHPYDIVYAAGSVWVTENTGNKIARFDPVAETWMEYQIPTDASQPTGLTVLAGDPIQVWFCEQASSKLGLLTITAAGASHVAEFPLPWTGAELESVAATSSENVWFTAPGKSIVGQFALSAWPDPVEAFGWAPTGTGTRPHDIKIDGENLPWFTEPVSNRIGRVSPATTTNFEWYPVRTSQSGLMGLDIALGYVWFTEYYSGRVGQLQKVGFAGKIHEQPVPGVGSAPTDVAVGPDGCAWISASGVNTLVSWCPPYFRELYLPLIQRN